MNKAGGPKIRDYAAMNDSEALRAAASALELDGWPRMAFDLRRRADRMERDSKSKIIVELEIEGDHAHAFAVVDSVLDSGVFQDAINDFEDDVPNVRVVSVISRRAGDAA